MSVLLIVSDTDGEALASSPLARSLAAQLEVAWTFEAPADEPIATVGISAETRLRAGALAAIAAAFADHPSVEALIADAIVGGTRQLRPAWSPTAVGMGRADELDLVAVRGRATLATMADRIDALAELEPTAIAHLPVALVERTGAQPIDSDAEAALDRLVSRRYRRPTPTTVSFVIPTAGARDDSGQRHVVQAIEAARSAGIDDREILLVVGEEFDGDPGELEGPDVRIVNRSSPWNFSVAVNTGLLAATNDAVVLLNDDVEGLDDGWLSPLLAHLGDPDVALVGTALLYPDLTVQHLGMVIDDALPLHPFVGERLDTLPAWARRPREVAAVTAACAVARRADLLTVGGLNEALPANFNDVDLCFKLHRRVGRVIVDPRSPLVHHESASRVPVIEGWEWEAFVTRWGEVIDPWYHPGHHRPDDPNDRRRNADHLPARDPDGRWPLRIPAIEPQVHRARLAAPSGTPGPE